MIEYISAYFGTHLVKRCGNYSVKMSLSNRFYFEAKMNLQYELKKVNE